MHIADFSPSSLSFYDDLETIAAVVSSDVIDELERQLADQGDLIDRDFELQNPMLFDYAKFIAAVLIDAGARDEYHEQARRAAYRGVHFGYLLCNTLLGEGVVLPAGHYLQQYDENTLADDMQSGILADTQGYLQRRPHVDALIGRYLPELDEEQQAPEIAETAAALTCAQIDSYYRSMAIELYTETMQAPDDLSE